MVIYLQIGTTRVIQDQLGVVHGAWINHYCGDYSVETAELMVVCDGLRFSLTHGFRHVFIESDAINIVNTIKNKGLFWYLGLNEKKKLDP